MKRFVLSALILCFSLHLIASVPFVVSGLQTGDKAVVSISSNEYLSTLEITSNGEYYFEDVPSGTHSLKLEASGYNLPMAKTIVILDDGSVQPAVAIELAVTDLAERYGIYVWGKPAEEMPEMDELTGMQISFLDVLSMQSLCRQPMAA